MLGLTSLGSILGLLTGVLSVVQAIVLLYGGIFVYYWCLLKQESLGFVKPFKCFFNFNFFVSVCVKLIWNNMGVSKWLEFKFKSENFNLKY